MIRKFGKTAVVGAIAAVSFSGTPLAMAQQSEVEQIERWCRSTTLSFADWADQNNVAVGQPSPKYTVTAATYPQALAGDPKIAIFATTLNKARVSQIQFVSDQNDRIVSYNPYRDTFNFRRINSEGVIVEEIYAEVSGSMRYYSTEIRGEIVVAENMVWSADRVISSGNKIAIPIEFVLERGVSLRAIARIEEKLGKDLMPTQPCQP